MIETLALWTALSTAALAVAWVGTKFAPRNASIRHLIWLTAFIGLLAMPLLTLVIPGRIVKVEPQPTYEVALVDIPLDYTPEPISTPQPFDWSPILSCITILWIVGIVAIAGKALAGIVHAARIRRQSQLISAPNLPSKPVSRRWELKVSSTKRPPAAMTWGTLRPVVILPQNSDQWSDQRTKTVLLHELAHVRRLDSLSQLLALAVCAVFWFNPVIWFAAKAMRAEAELAADDGVIRSGVKPSDYAAVLLELATEFGHQRQPLTTIGVSILKQSHIETRIMSIVNPNNRRRGVAGLEGITVLTVGLAAALAIVSLRPDTAQSAPKTAPIDEVKVQNIPAQEFPIPKPLIREIPAKIDSIKLEKRRDAELSEVRVDEVKKPVAPTGPLAPVEVEKAKVPAIEEVKVRNIEPVVLQDKLKYSVQLAQPLKTVHSSNQAKKYRVETLASLKPVKRYRVETLSHIKSEKHLKLSPIKTEKLLRLNTVKNLQLTNVKPLTNLKVSNVPANLSFKTKPLTNLQFKSANTEPYSVEFKYQGEAEVQHKKEQERKAIEEKVAHDRYLVEVQAKQHEAEKAKGQDAKEQKVRYEVLLNLKQAEEKQIKSRAITLERTRAEAALRKTLKSREAERNLVIRKMKEGQRTAEVRYQVQLELKRAIEKRDVDKREAEARALKIRAEAKAKAEEDLNRKEKSKTGGS